MESGQVSREARCPSIGGFQSSGVLLEVCKAVISYSGINLCSSYCVRCCKSSPFLLNGAARLAAERSLSCAPAGMSAGVPRYSTVNLEDLSKFSEDEEVTLEAIIEKRILSTSGREKRLPLKVSPSAVTYDKGFLLALNGRCVQLPVSMTRHLACVRRLISPGLRYSSVAAAVCGVHARLRSCHSLQVLGEGDLPGKLQIKAESFSKSALEKIEAAGGKAEVVPRRPKCELHSPCIDQILVDINLSTMLMCRYQGEHWQICSSAHALLPAA